MLELEDYWFVEYSVQQKSYNYMIFSEMIAKNEKLVNEGINNGYVIIGGPFKTMDEAIKFRKEYQDKNNLPEG